MNPAEPIADRVPDPGPADDDAYPAHWRTARTQTSTPNDTTDQNSYPAHWRR